MIIREAHPADRGQIVALHEKSQQATGLPNPAIVPPTELGDRLYARDAINRYVAVDQESIIGHGLIEHPNPEHLAQWREATINDERPLVELGGAFVDPSRIGEGVWSTLLFHRLYVVRSMGAIPVSVTWSVNHHVRNHFKEIGGMEIAQKKVGDSEISLFIL